jgi:hypothetical protein
MSRRRQGRGDYPGASTVVSASGWGFSKPERSLKKKELERKKAAQSRSDAVFADREKQRKGKRPDPQARIREPPIR